MNKTKQKWNKLGSKEFVVVVVVVVVLVEEVVSDEADLDEDENMEAFKNLFDKSFFYSLYNKKSFLKKLKHPLFKKDRSFQLRILI